MVAHRNTGKHSDWGGSEHTALGLSSLAHVRVCAQHAPEPFPPPWCGRGCGNVQPLGRRLAHTVQSPRSVPVLLDVADCSGVSGATAPAWWSGRCAGQTHGG